jgi:hypothetical protein
MNDSLHDAPHVGGGRHTRLITRSASGDAAPGLCGQLQGFVNTSN